jgi:hypothetical protein
MNIPHYSTADPHSERIFSKAASDDAAFHNRTIACASTPIAFLAVAIFLILFAAGHQASARTMVQASYYVDPNVGSDSNNGSISSPFRTITKARNVVRTINGNMSGDIIVYLRGGRYEITSTIELTEADKATNNRNIVYTAYRDEKPVISGGRRLTGWTIHNSGMNIWKANVNVGERFRQIYIDGTRGIRARTPNRTELGSLGPYYRGLETNSMSPYEVSVNASEVSNWSNFGEVELVMMHHWRHARCRLSSYNVNGARANLVFQYLERNVQFMGQWFHEGNAAHFYENAMEFLDAPGEFYLNTSTNVLYYMPREGEDMAAVNVTIPKLDYLLLVHGTTGNLIKNVCFRGITFEHSNWTRPNDVGFLNGQGATEVVNNIWGGNEEIAAAIAIWHADSVRLDGCTVRHVGGHAIQIWDDSTNCTVAHCNISALSGGGIYLHCWSVNSTGNKLLNNTIEHLGLDYTCAQGINSGLTPYLTVRNNDVTYCRYSGISVGNSWGDETTVCRNVDVSYNKVAHCMLLHSDGGGIYTFGNIPNSTFNYNHIKNVNRSAWAGPWPDSGIPAIYLDNGSTGKTVRGNVSNDCDALFYAWNLPNWGNTLIDSFYNQGYGWVRNENTQMNNQYVSEQNWPSAAWSAINNAGRQYSIHGLRAEYYDNMDLTNLKVVRHDPNINFSWGGGSPDGSIGGDTYSARWTGFIEPRYTEAYTFYTTADDGERLWIDGQLISDRWQDDGGTTYASTVVNLVANQRYEIVYEMFENSGNASAKLEWLSASQVREVVPQSRLFLPGTAPGLVNGGVYKILAQCSNKCLDVAEGATQDGANVHQWGYAGSNNQKWRIEYTGGGFYRLVAMHSGKVLHVPGGETQNGANINQFTDWAVDWERWGLQLQGDGTFEIKAKHSGKNADVNGASAENGANVHQWEDNDSWAQRWNFVPLQSPGVVSHNAAASASSIWSSGYGAWRANDGVINGNAGWSASSSDFSPWWQVDLGSGRRVTRIEIVGRPNIDNPATRRNFQIWLSNQSVMSPGAYIVAANCNSTGFPHQNTWSVDLPAGSMINYRYLALVKTVSEYMYIEEIRVFGY